MRTRRAARSALDDVPSRCEERRGLTFVLSVRDRWELVRRVSFFASVRGQMGVGTAKRVRVLLAMFAAGLVTCLFFGRSYLLREALLFVALAALLTLFVVNLMIVGLLARSAVRTIHLLLRRARFQASSQPELGAFARVGPIRSRGTHGGENRVSI